MLDMIKNIRIKAMINKWIVSWIKRVYSLYSANSKTLYRHGNIRRSYAASKFYL